MSSLGCACAAAVFIWFKVENVCGFVVVVATTGADMNVFAMFTLEVGNNGFVFVAVILLPGIGCIGAYLISPTWLGYGIANLSLAMLDEESDDLPAAMLLVVGGPAVPETDAKAVMISGLNFPVMPLSEKRGE